MPLAVKVGAAAAVAYVIFCAVKAHNAGQSLSWALLNPLAPAPGAPVETSTAVVLPLFGPRAPRISRALTNAFR